MLQQSSMQSRSNHHPMIDRLRLKEEVLRIETHHPLTFIPSMPLLLLALLTVLVVILIVAFKLTLLVPVGGVVFLTFIVTLGLRFYFWRNDVYLITKSRIIWDCRRIRLVASRDI